MAVSTMRNLWRWWGKEMKQIRRSGVMYLSDFCVFNCLCGGGAGDDDDDEEVTKWKMVPRGGEGKSYLIAISITCMSNVQKNSCCLIHIHGCFFFPLFNVHFRRLDWEGNGCSRWLNMKKQIKIGSSLQLINTLIVISFIPPFIRKVSTRD